MAGTLVVTIGDRSVRLARQPDGRIEIEPDATVSVTPAPARGEFVAEINGRRQTLFAVRTGDVAWVFRDGVTYEAAIADDAQARARAIHHQGALMAPMPATVVAVNVKPGDAVDAGQILLVLEAMKMELPIRAPGDAVVEAVHCAPGDLVQPNVGLIVLSPRP